MTTSLRERPRLGVVTGGVRSIRTATFSTLILVIALAGCAGSPSAPAGQAAPGAGAGQPAQESPSQTLTMTVRYETNALAPKAVTGLGVNATLPLFDAYATTLDRSERNQRVIEMMRLTSEQLPVFPLYFNIVVLAHLSKVRGPAGGTLDSLPLWNVYEWELQ